jgi:oligopeptide/dipeptide ABC transporter ATP-binding protein
MSELLRLEAVSKIFSQRRNPRNGIRAVSDVTIGVRRNETLGVVGESGCGKSTLARIALRLVDPTNGRIFFDGADISSLKPRRLMAIRRRMQAIFQDPLASFNPGMTIAEIMQEPFEIHGLSTPDGNVGRIQELLSSVGLEGIRLQKRPSEFSGGQLQRIAIARALTLEPDLIVADEPTSALDPSIQAQVVNLLLRIQKERGIAYLVISHDLDIIGHISDRIAVMYLGGIVETGPGPALMRGPLHPYTQALLSAAPTLRARRDRGRSHILLQGDPPNPARAPAGCRFHGRCPLARSICETEPPRLRPIDDDGHSVACHFAPDETQERGRRIALARLGDPVPSSHSPEDETIKMRLREK